MPAAALAFSPLGLTVTFTAASSVPTSAQAASSAPLTRPAYQYRIHNVGAEVVLLGVGVDNATAVAKAASIGAGAICVAPITVGHWAMVAAGSVAIRDVQDFELVAGNPAKHVGWVGRSGKRLAETDDNVWTCSLTGEVYFLDPNAKLTLREKRD